MDEHGNEVANMMRSRQQKFRLPNNDDYNESAESDIMETSAIDGTSENNDNESYDHESDSCSQQNRSSKSQDEMKNSISNDDNRSLLATRTSNKLSGPDEPTTNASYNPVITTNAKVSGTRLISRRKRSYRWRRSNYMTELDYDHDGDIDRSDGDDDDDNDNNDGDDNNCYNGNDEADDLNSRGNACSRTTNAFGMSINRWRQDKSTFLRPRMYSGNKEKDVHLRVGSNGNDGDQKHLSSTLDEINYSGENILNYSNNISNHNQGVRHQLGTKFNINSSHYTTVQCNESESTENWTFLSSLKKLLKLESSAESLKQYKHSDSVIVELKKCNRTAKCRRPSDVIPGAFEWPPKSLANNHQHSNMPSNYGSNCRHKSFQSFDEYKSTRRTSYKGKRDSRTRFSLPNAYARLGYYHQQKSSKQSILPE